MFLPIRHWINLNCVWLVIFLGVFLLRAPTLFEPYWYGDEGIYLTIGQAMRHGEVLYKDIHDNKPPLLYLMAYIADGQQFWFRMIALWWNVLTVMVFYLISKKLFIKKMGVVSLTVIVFVLITNLPFLEGNIANAELFFLLPVLAAAYLLMAPQVSIMRIFWGGILIGIGGLFKAPALIEMIVWPLLWLSEGNRWWFKRSVTLLFGVVTPLLLCSIYFGLIGVFRYYFSAAWIQNSAYVSSWKSGGVMNSLQNRVVGLSVILAVWVGRFKNIGRRSGMLAIWAVVAFFAATLSGRPYPHYLLQAAGVLALCLGIVVGGTKLERIVGSFVCLLFGLIFVMFGFYIYKVPEYYLNFLSWATGGRSRQEYFEWFDEGIMRGYTVAEIISKETKEGDRIFIWGDMPAIYALARRLPVGKYTTSYHIKDFKAQASTLALLMSQFPKYIVCVESIDDLPGLRKLLENNYYIESKIGNITIFKFNNLGEN